MQAIEEVQSSNKAYGKWRVSAAYVSKITPGGLYAITIRYFTIA